MPLHRRYQRKQSRNKLKSVDPFNPHARQLKDAKNKHRNLAPKGSELLDEEMPKIALEIQAAQQKIDEMASRPRKKRNKNKFLAEAAKLGFKKQKGETDEHLVDRIEADTQHFLDVQKLKANEGMAGRADKDMAKDIALLDEKAARKKERRKIISEKIVDQKLERLQQLMTEDGDLEDQTVFDKIRRGQVDEPNEEENSDGEQGFPKPKTSEADEGDEPRKVCGKKLKRQRRKEEMKKYREEQDQADQLDLALNRKETIEFGERYDAPPTFDFDKNLKDKMVGKMAKAGAKNLLLKNLIPKQKEETTVYKKSEVKIKEFERQRVIDAYRNLKRQKAANHSMQALRNSLKEEAQGQEAEGDYSD